MPPKKRRNRSRKAPNVYVQAQREREEIEQRTTDVPAESNPDAVPTVATSPRGSATVSERPRTSRLTQTTRSDVYAASIPNEIRKMGILTAGVLAALVVFSVILG